MAYTGERMVPELADKTTVWEHLYRYKFARPYVRGRAVLDIACGEGYGSCALLRGGASSVIGVDISVEACSHAVEKYAIDARQGQAESIPIQESSIDVVVSFETIEHVQDPRRFLAEIKRVLRPGGVLVISTPNKAVYASDYSNPFHCSEMDLTDFVRVLSERFRYLELHIQVPTSGRRYWFISLALRNSPWLILGKFKSVRRRFSHPFVGGVLEKARSDPIGEILRPDDSFFSDLFNPYLVRQSSEPSKQLPLYYVAVCR